MEQPTPRSVILLNIEDDFEDTILPRLPGTTPVPPPSYQTLVITLSYYTQTVTLPASTVPYIVADGTTPITFTTAGGSVTLTVNYTSQPY